MRSDLYEDLYKKEDNYWWFCGRRMFVDTLLRLLERSDLPSPQPSASARFHVEGRTSSEMKILDAGCGTGRQMEELLPNALASGSSSQVFGFDISDEALNFCKQRGLQNIIRADLNQPLPYPDESFDLITALDVLEHIKNDQFALSELKRVLKNAGHLIITVPAHPFLWSYWDKSIHHYRRYTKKELKEKLEVEGLQIKRLGFTNFFIFLPTIIIRIIRSFIFKSQSKQSSSDFVQLPLFLNKMMIGIYRFENLVFKTMDLPTGVSLIALVKKP